MCYHNLSYKLIINLMVNSSLVYSRVCLTREIIQFMFITLTTGKTSLLMNNKYK